MHKDITVQQLKEKIEKKENFILLDVRTKEEYKEGHINSSILIPYDELEKRHTELNADKTTEIIVFCRSGNRSQVAANTLTKLGYTNISNVLNGMIEWEENDYPISK